MVALVVAHTQAASTLKMMDESGREARITWKNDVLTVPQHCRESTCSSMTQRQDALERRLTSLETAQVSTLGLVQDLVAALSTKKITTPDRKVITTPLDKEKAESSRDALAKVIYGRMFNWLVKRLNKSTECDSGVSKRFIGILDIYGFEDLETRSRNPQTIYRKMNKLWK